MNMEIKRQARNNIVKRPEIFGNSNAVFCVPLQKLAIFLRCKKGMKGKKYARQKGQQHLGNPSQASKITCQMGHPIGGVPFSWYVTNPPGGDGSTFGCLLCLGNHSCTYLRSSFTLKTISNLSRTIGGQIRLPWCGLGALSEAHPLPRPDRRNRSEAP